MAAVRHRRSGSFLDLDASLFDQLADVAGRLDGLGLADLAAEVRATLDLARTRPDQASAKLRDLVPRLMEHAPAVRT